MRLDKLAYVREHIGSEELLKSFLENNKLVQKDKQALQWGYQELQKDRPNAMFVDDAYKVLAKIDSLKQTIDDDIKNTTPTQDQKKQADGENTKINTSFGDKPSRKSYMKYLTIPVLLVGVYIFINSNTATEEKDSIESNSNRAPTSSFFSFSSDTSLLPNIEKIIEYEKVSKFNNKTRKYKMRVLIDDSNGFNIKMTNVGKRTIYIDLIAIMDDDEVKDSIDPSIKIEPGKSESYDAMGGLFALKQYNLDRIEFLSGSTTIFTIDSKNMDEDQKMYYDFYREGVYRIGDPDIAFSIRIGHLKGDALKSYFQESFPYIERACDGGISDACVFRRQISNASNYKELLSMFSKKYEEIKNKVY